MSIDAYTVISAREISDLATKKAPASATLVYMSLLSFCYGTKTTCFPSIQTIRERLGGAYSERTISWALRWLADHSFIRRGHKRAKDRFTMLKRVIKKTAEKVFESLKPKEARSRGTQSKISREKTPREKTSYLREKYKKFRKSKSKRVQFAKPEQPAPKTKAEQLWERMILSSSCGLPQPSALNPDERAVIAAERQRGGCLEWTVEVYPDELLWSFKTRMEVR